MMDRKIVIPAKAGIQSPGFRVKHGITGQLLRLNHSIICKEALDSPD